MFWEKRLSRWVETMQAMQAAQELHEREKGV